MSVYEKFKQIIDEWDPIDVLSVSSDEYVPVVEELADTITPAYNLNSVYRVLRRVFRIYGVDFRKSDEECRAIAEKLKQAISE